MVLLIYMRLNNRDCDSLYRGHIKLLRPNCKKIDMFIYDIIALY